MTPSQETKVLIVEGMAHESRKADKALLALAVRQEAEAFDLRHGEGEFERIERNRKAWNEEV